MKKVVLLFCIFVIQLSYAQNWSILNTTEKFNYRLDGGNLIASTIWVDSFQVAGNDSVFFMNRILCDSCITIVNGPGSGCSSCYGNKSAPNIFQKVIYLKDSIYNLTDTGNIIIHPFANLNDTWLFDSAWNINAQVVQVYSDSVFSTVDSVKLILLSTGDTVAISQNHGLLIYPSAYNSGVYYRLAGIEGRNAGEMVPRFYDFFNFDIGDMFEYHNYVSIGGGCSYWEIRQYTIKSKLISGDTLRYQIEGVYEYKEQGNGWGGCGSASYSFGHYQGSIEYIDSLNHFTNKYIHQPINLKYEIVNSLPCADNDTAYDGVRMDLDQNGVISKSFGLNFGFFGGSFYTQINRNSDTLLVDPGGPYAASYKVGLGQVIYAFAPCFEGGEWGELVAYKKGNTTVGTFSDSTSILLHTDDLKSSSTIIYPNPVSDKLFIHHSKHGNLKVSIFNSYGALMKEANTVSISDFIQVDDLPEGIYFVNYVSDNSAVTRRILIIH